METNDQLMETNREELKVGDKNSDICDSDTNPTALTITVVNGSVGLSAANDRPAHENTIDDTAHHNDFIIQTSTTLSPGKGCSNQDLRKSSDSSCNVCSLTSKDSSHYDKEAESTQIEKDSPAVQQYYDFSPPPVMLATSLISGDCSSKLSDQFIVNDGTSMVQGQSLEQVDEASPNKQEKIGAVNCLNESGGSNAPAGSGCESHIKKSHCHCIIPTMPLFYSKVSSSENEAGDSMNNACELGLGYMDCVYPEQEHILAENSCRKNQLCIVEGPAIQQYDEVTQGHIKPANAILTSCNITDDHSEQHFKDSIKYDALEVSMAPALDEEILKRSLEDNELGIDVSSSSGAEDLSVTQEVSQHDCSIQTPLPVSSAKVQSSQHLHAFSNDMNNVTALTMKEIACDDPETDDTRTENLVDEDELYKTDSPVILECSGIMPAYVTPTSSFIMDVPSEDFDEVPVEDDDKITFMMQSSDGLGLSLKVVVGNSSLASNNVDMEGYPCQQRLTPNDHKPVDSCVILESSVQGCQQGTEAVLKLSETCDGELTSASTPIITDITNCKPALLTGQCLETKHGIQSSPKLSYYEDIQNETESDFPQELNPWAASSQEESTMYSPLQDSLGSEKVHRKLMETDVFEEQSCQDYTKDCQNSNDYDPTLAGSSTNQENSLNVNHIIHSKEVCCDGGNLLNPCDACMPPTTCSAYIDGISSEGSGIQNYQETSHALQSEDVHEMRTDPVSPVCGHGSPINDKVDASRFSKTHNNKGKFNDNTTSIGPSYYPQKEEFPLSDGKADVTMHEASFSHMGEPFLDLNCAISGNQSSERDENDIGLLENLQNEGVDQGNTSQILLVSLPEESAVLDQCNVLITPCHKNMLNDVQTQPSFEDVAEISEISFSDKSEGPSQYLKVLSNGEQVKEVDCVATNSDSRCVHFASPLASYAEYSCESSVFSQSASEADDSIMQYGLYDELHMYEENTAIIYKEEKMSVPHAVPCRYTDPIPQNFLDTVIEESTKNDLVQHQANIEIPLVPISVPICQPLSSSTIITLHPSITAQTHVEEANNDLTECLSMQQTDECHLSTSNLKRNDSVVNFHQHTVASLLDSLVDQVCQDIDGNLLPEMKCGDRQSIIESVTHLIDQSEEKGDAPELLIQNLLENSESGACKSDGNVLEEQMECFNHSDNANMNDSLPSSDSALVPACMLSPITIGLYCTFTPEMSGNNDTYEDDCASDESINRPDKDEPLDGIKHHSQDIDCLEDETVPFELNCDSAMPCTTSPMAGVKQIDPFVLGSEPYSSFETGCSPPAQHDVDNNEICNSSSPKKMRLTESPSDEANDLKIAYSEDDQTVPCEGSALGPGAIASYSILQSIDRREQFLETEMSLSNFLWCANKKGHTMIRNGDYQPTDAVMPSCTPPSRCNRSLRVGLSRRQHLPALHPKRKGSS